MSFNDELNATWEALEALASVPVPEGDNAGEALNSPSVYEVILDEDQAVVAHAEESVRSFLLRTGDEGLEANPRAVRAMLKRGATVVYQPAEDDPCRMVGYVTFGECKLDLSDPPSQVVDY